MNVALLTECVDRNYYNASVRVKCYCVALLTECVDRNFSFCQSMEIRYGRTPYGVRG